MPDQNQTDNMTTPTGAPVAPATPVLPDVSADSASDADAAQESTAPADTSDTAIMAEVASKIAEAHNILIALSSDPTVDELATAIGLSLCLDRVGKRATAIYSGSTPNALEFLKPDEIFEDSADTLQDFVIALNKDKADHLRYKLDGDYVKIFITPYRSRIAEEDLEFSYGDFNIDLVLALNVANGIDLDAALREHGRIMHDAVIVDITTGNPGKLGEIEWSDKKSSSVAEMISNLLFSLGKKLTVEKEEATAFLTAIVAATDHFTKPNTTPRTMQIAGKLMEAGADQQLVSQNIAMDTDNQLFSLPGDFFNKPKEEADGTALDISHKPDAEESEEQESSQESAPEPESEPNTEEDSLAADLKAAEESLANAAAETTPETVQEPLRIDSDEGSGTEPSSTGVNLTPSPEFTATSEPVPASDLAPVESAIKSDFISSVKPEKILAPSEGFNPDAKDEGSSKYGQMLEEALAEANAAEPAPLPNYTPEPAPSSPSSNPASSIAPPVATEPEINGVPEINYMPMPGDEILPPPPTPPIDFETPMPAAPVAPEVESAVPEPALQEPAPQEAPQQPPNPGAFKIPGM